MLAKTPSPPPPPPPPSSSSSSDDDEDDPAESCTNRKKWEENVIVCKGTRPFHRQGLCVLCRPIQVTIDETSSFYPSSLISLTFSSLAQFLLRQSSKHDQPFQLLNSGDIFLLQLHARMQKCKYTGIYMYIYTYMYVYIFVYIHAMYDGNRLLYIMSYDRAGPTAIDSSDIYQTVMSRFSSTFSS
eukprot:gb/GEZN01018151.1/.p1 GENE.gb/GEZN01018151.1/~~gb/GEZN01018151.1/.p1  ORF type:complete len:185 (-),score=36.73 gb/GEZN01018151.1/:115-669(-)